MKKIEKSIKVGGKKLTLATGHIAEQATGAVLATMGETVVLVTVVSAPLREDLGYFPLMVEYRERLSAGGRIKGSRWVKRAGRPTDEEILTARLIDRSIRPLFDTDYERDVQVIVQVLSVDKENPPDMIAGVGVSAAISASSIPWGGPVAIIRVGLEDGQYSTNPVRSEMATSQMDLIVTTTADAVVMIEASANEVEEKAILAGVSYAQDEGKKIVKFIQDFAKEVGVKKEPIEKDKIDASLTKKVKELAGTKIKDLIRQMATKKVGYAELDEVKVVLIETFGEENKKAIKKLFDEMFTAEVRKLILSGKRPDGRKPDEIRNLSAEVGVLPRVHGSAIFQRGQTQALTVATLGSPSLEQLLETAEGEETKRYIHHYGMPPYSLGETGRYGFSSRREIGHGVLAERALMPVIPSKEEFPYTIFVLTEILSSNGSTSMAATCGSTLSLMDAGVPLKAPVAGIAMGLIIKSDKEFVVLTDIVGLEDGSGDMDFKVAGTLSGITALQMDVKTLNLTLPILEEALVQAKKARKEILKAMAKGIKEPRKEVSKFAPKIRMVKVPKEKIGEVIGPGGKVIRKLMEETNTQVDVDDDGNVSIAGEDEAKVQKAVDWVEGVTKEAQAGEIYDGVVKRIEPYGAFVEILPGKDGLVHVSSMSEDFVKDPNDIVSIGDKVKVRVKKVEFGKIDLSMVLDASKDRDKGRSPQRGGERRGRPGGGREERGGQRERRRPGRSSGPHFPTSRFIDQKRKSFSR